MRITAYSLTMACLWTSVVALIMRATQMRKRSLQHFGMNSIFILYAFCVIRLLLPIEIPRTKVIPVEGVFNTATLLLTKTVIGDAFQVKDVLLIIWGCGTLFKLVLLRKDYRATKKMLCNLPIQNEGTAYELLECLQKQRGDKRKIQIYTTPFLVPMETGIWHPAILLPNREYVKQDLYYIIKHEYTHILHHDTLIKLLLNLCKCIFWWNLVIYLINKDIENTLELKCDLTIAREMGENEKAQYLSAILSVVQSVEREKAQRRLPQNINTLCNAYGQDIIVKRFHSVSEYRAMKGREKLRYQMYTAVVIMVCVIVYRMSYSFVFQSNFETPMEEMMKGEGIVHILELETTFLKEKEGRYEVICENQCIGVVEENVALWMQEQGFEIR